MTHSLSDDGETIVAVPAVRITGGPGYRGHPSAARYHSTDDFYPVLQYAAHALARRMRRSGELIAGLPRNVALLVATDQRAAAPNLIELYRGVTIDREKTLKKYRRYLRTARPDLKPPAEMSRYLETAIRSFLAMSPAPNQPADRADHHREVLLSFLHRQ